MTEPKPYGTAISQPPGAGRPGVDTARWIRKEKLANEPVWRLLLADVEWCDEGGCARSECVSCQEDDACE